MSPKDSTTDQGYRARVPADVDAPDKVAYGLTFRQLAILAVAAVFFYAGWHSLHTVAPAPVLLAAGGLLGALTFGVAVGTRDGLPMDVWLLAAIRHSRTPHALSPTETPAVADWVQAPTLRVALPAPLRLPADAIDTDGEIHLGDTRAAIVAASSVNLALRTADEQAALVDGFGRWLNSLSTTTQIVVSSQPVDLYTAAKALAQAADHMPHPALAQACADHGRFLDELAARRDPLRRQVLIVTQAGPGEHGARRRAQATVRGLAALGVATRVLDGPAATAVLAAAADPYRSARPAGMAVPGAVITGPTPTARRRSS